MKAMRQETVTRTIYKFEELSDKAKDKAREWYRVAAAYDEWWDCIYADAKTIGLKITSFDLDRSRHAKGELVETPVTVARLIIENHGESCETHKTAREYQEIVAAINERATEDDDLIEELEQARDEFKRSLLEDYSIMLRKEYEYLQSDEYVDETIEANDYEFTEKGERA
jgi:hypothetical protein